MDFLTSLCFRVIAAFYFYLSRIDCLSTSTCFSSLRPLSCLYFHVLCFSSLLPYLSFCPSLASLLIISCLPAHVPQVFTSLFSSLPCYCLLIYLLITLAGILYSFSVLLYGSLLCVRFLFPLSCILFVAFLSRHDFLLSSYQISCL